MSQTEASSGGGGGDEDVTNGLYLWAAENTWKAMDKLTKDPPLLPSEKDDEELLYLCADFRGKVMWARVDASKQSDFEQSIAFDYYQLLVIVYTRSTSTGPWKRIITQNQAEQGFTVHEHCVKLVPGTCAASILRYEELDGMTQMYALPLDFAVVWAHAIENS